METEAKFIVPGEATFARLRDVERFGPYDKRDEKTKTVHDRYVDTPDHRFYQQQLYVRLREASEGDILLTIKRLGGPPDGAIHSRDEYQTTVPSLTREEWPDSQVRSMVEEVAGDQPLGDLVAVDQTRTVSILYQGDREVAELSLDEVTIETAHEPVTIYELEAELLPDGLTSDLRILVRVFTDEYGLDPQPLTKFERALRMAAADEVPQATKRRVRDAKRLAAPERAGDGLGEPLLESGLSEPSVVIEGIGDAGGGASTRNLSADHAPTVPMPSAAPISAQPGEASPVAIEGTAPISTQRPPLGVLPTDSIDVAGRKIVRSYYEAMLANEEGTIAGEDPMPVHDMRVATRRMRAALRVLGPFLRESDPRDVRRGLKEVAQSLGEVRDLDVLLVNAEKFRATLPEDQQTDLDGLLSAWQDERTTARKQMLRLLTSKDYSRFKKRMKAFIEQREKKKAHEIGSELEPYQVRHIAPSVILARYEAVRSFEALTDGERGKTKDDAGEPGDNPRSSPTLPVPGNPQFTLPPTIEQLHALRISGKYLRYTLECFRETLPPESKELMRDIAKMQDQLGKLHDADAAATLIKAYISKQSKRRKKRGPEYIAPPGLLAYLENRQAAIERIHTNFLSTWTRLQSAEWRARLAAVIMV